MEFSLDQDMNLCGPAKDPEPVIFVPEVDMDKLEDPNIIAAF